MLTRGVSCEGKFCKFSKAFGHLNLESRKLTIKSLFLQLCVVPFLLVKVFVKVTEVMHCCMQKGVK